LLHKSGTLLGQSLSKITSWSAYNKALVQRGALTFWMDESVIEQWHCQMHHGRRGRGYTYSDEAITTALMVKGIFKLLLRALQGFINSIFNVMQIDLMSHDYSSISKRAKHIDIPIWLPRSGKVTDLVIDATGLKVYGEGEWKVKKHSADKRRTWRKLHLAVDPKSHAISWDEVHPRSQAANQIEQTSRKQWKQTSGYHRRNIAENTMYRVKQLLSAKLTLRHYDNKLTEIMAGLRAINKMNSLGMPVRNVRA
jgi:hypothetical protein